MRRSVAILVMSLLVLVPLWVSSSRREAADVTTQTVRRSEIRLTTVTTGKTVYAKQVVLRPESIGRVKRIHVAEGDRVAAGQTLVTLDQADAQAQIEQQEAGLRSRKAEVGRARERLAELRLKLDRHNELLERRLVGRAFYDELAAEVRVAEFDLESALAARNEGTAALDLARQLLDKTVVTSPISGVVTSVGVSVGEVVVPSAAAIPGVELITVSDLDSLIVETYVDESDVADLKVGQPAEVKVPALRARTFRGDIERIGIVPRHVDGWAGLRYPVRVALDRTGTGIDVLKPGMNCRVTVSRADREGVIVVPVSAVLTEEADEPDVRHFVYVIEDGRATRKYIRLGVSDDLQYEVFEGLKVGDVVIDGPAPVLRHLYPDAEVSRAKGRA